MTTLLSATDFADLRASKDPTIRGALAYLERAEKRLNYLAANEPPPDREEPRAGDPSHYAWEAELLGIWVHCDARARELTSALWTNERVRLSAFTLAALLRDLGEQARETRDSWDAI